jgi:hypothetical protein
VVIAVSFYVPRQVGVEVPVSRRVSPVHPGFAGGRVDLVVAHQAAVEHQGAEGLLDPPSDRLGHEPLVLRVALDDLVLEALVHQGLGDGVGAGRDPVEQCGADLVLVHAGRRAYLALSSHICRSCST